MSIRPPIDILGIAANTRALVCALKHRDNHTQMHSQRVIDLSELLGKACELTLPELVQLRYAACFHDVGKIGIPDEILLKPGKLSDAEWQVMKTHSEIGEDIVRNLDLEEADIAAKAVRHHHEHFDGSGYPDRLAGEDIPLFSRIISIVDSYDAMAETRPYHEARTHEQTMEILLNEAGTKFDPYLLARFELSVIRKKF